MKRASVIWYDSMNDRLYGFRHYGYIGDAETAAAKDSLHGVQYAFAMHVCHDAAIVSVYEDGKRIMADIVPVCRLQQAIEIARNS